MGLLNEFRGAVFVIILWMWTSRQSRLTINFIAPSVGKRFDFYLKNAKILDFRIRPLLGKKSKFDLLGWHNECRSAVFVIILWMWTSRQSRLIINFIAPSVGKWFNFKWNTAKNYVFRRRPLLGKNSKFDLLGWLNRCRGAVFVIILWMWTSKQSRLTINFIAPSVGKCFKFHLKKCQKLRFSQKNFTWEKQ